jgi:hypothetical protein
MDVERFDGLTRTMSMGGSRRTVIRGLAGGVLAAFGLGREQAGAKGGRPATVDVCHYDDVTGTYSPMSVNEKALEGHRRHGDMLIAELDTGSDPAHCGGCGITCATGEICEEGVCVGAPPMIVAVYDGNLVEGGPVIAGDSCPYTIVGAPYDTYTINHPGGPMSLAVLGTPFIGGLFDPVVLLFAGASVPEGNMCFPRVGFDDDSGCQTDAYLEFADLAAGTYTALVTGYVGEPYGAYRFELNTFTGTDVCPE